MSGYLTLLVRRPSVVTGRDAVARIDRVVRRDADGSLWEPSYPETLSRAETTSAAVTGALSFYFRRIEPEPRPLWRRLLRRPPAYRRTGETWQPEGYGGWSVARA